jgi:hypothetical protein
MDAQEHASLSVGQYSNNFLGEILAAAYSAQASPFNKCHPYIVLLVMSIRQCQYLWKDFGGAA